MAKERTNAALRLVAAGMVAAGAALLWVSGLIPRDWPQWVEVVAQLGGLLVATGAVTFAWEQWGRRHFANELMAMAGLSTDLRKAGIRRVTNQYLADHELWDGLFRGARKVDIVVAYASTWRNTNRDLLERVARDGRARVRVFLPDPDDDDTMRVLAARFSTDPVSLVAKVREAITEFQSLRVPGGADLQVYIRSGDLVFSCYRFDSRAVITLYTHSRERQSSVPTFVVDDGDLFNFVYNDIRAIKAQSQVLSIQP